MKNNTELSERLRELRKKAGLSQEQLAEALHISRQAISKWESGVSNPDIYNVIQLGALYGITTDSILLGESAAPETDDSAYQSETNLPTPQEEDSLPVSPREEKLSVLDRFLANGFLWVIFGTLVTIVLYFVTNTF